MSSPHPAAGSAPAPAPAPGSVPLGAAPAPAPAAGAGYDPYPATGAPVTPRDRHDRDSAAGARAADDQRRRRRTPLAWLPWAALAALLLLLVASVLVATLTGRDGDGGAATSATAEDSARSGGQDGAGAQSGAGGAGGGEPAADSAGTLTAGSTDVLADGRVADLAALAGQDAVGRGVLVESVVADEGFWIGSSAEQRVFVFLTPEARQSAGESGYQVEAGQRIDLNGSVEELGDSAPAAFGVTEQEGAAQLTQQGAYVSATQVRLSAS